MSTEQKLINIYYLMATSPEFSQMFESDFPYLYITFTEQPEFIAREYVDTIFRWAQVVGEEVSEFKMHDLDGDLI